MEVSKVLCMNGGSGQTSYANNSFLQKRIIQASRSVMEEALVDLCCASLPDKLSIADLGCSSGPNALSVVRDMVGIVEERCRQVGRKLPEFQVFLNDVPGNDFNAVFLYLQAFYEEREASRRGGMELGHCFVAGVPGSFYGRLFQSRSIHFFHSSSCLHWLSQAPLTHQQHDEPLNKRSIYVSEESSPSVVDAYSSQFRKDFSDFLKFRSEEMVVGGHMVLILVGRKTLDPTSVEASNYHWSVLTRVLLDMVQEGYIAEEKVDSFNLPFYSPCSMEIENEIQREGSFSLKKLQIFELPWDACQRDHDNDTEHNASLSKKMAKGQAAANCIRAVVETMLANHFGADIIEDLFIRYVQVFEDYSSAQKSMLNNMVVSLVRNP